MKRPKFSVIVPVYKVEEYLETCVNSLLAQGMEEGSMEILLVDDGSPDRCGELCDELAVSYMAIQAIHKTNGGLSSARNAGMHKARGEYLIFVDSDDTLEPGALCRIEDALEKYGESDAVFYDGIEDDGSSRSSLRRILMEESGVTDNGRYFML